MLTDPKQECNGGHAMNGPNNARSLDPAFDRHRENADAMAIANGDPGIEWSDDPQPIRIRPASVPALDPSMLPIALRDWLEDIARRVSCPLDFPVVGALVALAIVIGRKIAIRPKREDDSFIVVANLWGAIIGSPGVLKTPALQQSMKPLDRLIAQSIDKHKEQSSRSSEAKLIAKAKADAAKKSLKEAAQKKKDASILEALARDANSGESDPDPTERRYSTQDATVERLGELLRENPNGIGVIRDELTGWIRALDKQGHECDRAFYLEAWNGNGSSFTYDRIGRGVVRIPNVCLSLVGTIQPGPLRSVLRDAAEGGSGDDGMISRFQMTVWPDIDEFVNVDTWPDTNAKKRAFAIYDRLDEMTASDFGATDEPDEIPYVRFDDEAQFLFDAWRVSLEHRLRSGTLDVLMESHLAKYRSLMPKLALIFYCVSVADGDGIGDGKIGGRHARMSLAWLDYLEAHARRVYSSVTGANSTPAAALAKKIEDAALESPFTTRDVARKHWSGLSEQSDVERAVDTLESLGWLKRIESDTAGRPREDIHIHPSLPRKIHGTP